MIGAGSLEYAYARLCARYGDRPSETAWQRIETVRGLGAMLDVARTSALGVWVRDIGADADVHAVERALRGHLRERIAATAAWMPPAWQPSIEWCAVMVDLPMLQHLARGGSSPDWLDDAALTATLSQHGAGERSAVAALLDRARADPDRLGSLWRAEWQRRVPRRATGAPALTDLVRLLSEHIAAFSTPVIPDAWALRRSLHARLSRLFRRAMLDPAAAFIFLLLSALDGERLRGEILRRVAFPSLPLAR